MGFLLPPPTTVQWLRFKAIFRSFFALLMISTGNVLIFCSLLALNDERFFHEFSLAIMAFFMCSMLIEHVKILYYIKKFSM